MNIEQSYISGFVKRAAEYGLNYSEALSLLKSAEKPGLWANIRAKRARGEKAAKPGDADYPDKKQWNKLTKSAYSYSDEMGEMNRWLDGGSPWSNRLHKDFYKDPKGVAALTKHFTDIVRSQGADVKFLSDSHYDDKTIKMSPEEAINKLLAQKELKFNADDAPNYYQIMYPFEQVGKFKWKDDKHPSQLSVDEYLKTLNTKAAGVIKMSRCWEGYESVPGKEPYSNDSCRPKKVKKKSDTK